MGDSMINQTTLRQAESIIRVRRIIKGMRDDAGEIRRRATTRPRERACAMIESAGLIERWADALEQTLTPPDPDDA